MYISWGTDLYGSVDEIPGVGHVATKFGFINYVPILPMGTYFVVAQTGDGWRGVDLPVSFKSILVAWLRTAAFIGIISTGIWLAIEGFAYRDNRPNDVLAAGVWFAACVCVMWASMKWRLLVGASYERAIEIADQIKAGDEMRIHIEFVYGRITQEEAQTAMDAAVARSEEVNKAANDAFLAQLSGEA